MAKSKLVVSFGISAGAKLIVILFLGNNRLALAKALRMRSFASSTALFPSPTIMMFGNPLLREHSTSITSPSNPLSRMLCTFMCHMLYTKISKRKAHYGLG
jgi:hypothetical protein